MKEEEAKQQLIFETNCKHAKQAKKFVLLILKIDQTKPSENTLEGHTRIQR